MHDDPTQPANDGIAFVHDPTDDGAWISIDSAHVMTDPDATPEWTYTLSEEGNDDAWLSMAEPGVADLAGRA